jgi:hypothetical protein
MMVPRNNNESIWTSLKIPDNLFRPLDRFGGAEGDRTPDLMTASHALSQLSYGPKKDLKSSVALK